MKSLSIILLAAMLLSCANKSEPPKDDMMNRVLEVAVSQIGFQTQLIEASGTILNPRTVKNNKIQYVQPSNWTSGFFPGTMWYMYKLTGDEKWKTLGIKYTDAIDSVRYYTYHHDVGFMINCSFGNAIDLAGLTQYNEVMVDAAKSLSTRFRDVPGVIQSWDVDNGWQSKRGWMCPVIIDNMMNLELLFKATRISGDSSFYKIAVRHADTTMKHQYREDYSCYHVIDYDCLKGHVRKKETAQGYSYESVWSRGQAWGLYGYVTCYRETKDKKYLRQAEKIAAFLLMHSVGSIPHGEEIDVPLNYADYYFLEALYRKEKLN